MFQNFVFFPNCRRRCSRSVGSETCPSSASSFAYGTTFPRMAVSGHSVTQAMQATQFSEFNSGISGAM
jgi:hypothetical protein